MIRSNNEKEVQLILTLPISLRKDLELTWRECKKAKKINRDVTLEEWIVNNLEDLVSFNPKE